MPKGAGRTTILVVDDDPLHRGLVRAIFEDDPYEVLEASDAAEGLESAIRNLPQLILVDMRMTRMSGLEFIQSARVHPDIKHIPIIVSTASASGPQGFECLRSGAAHYLPKPLDPEPFRLTVQKLLGHPLKPR
jgi:two-component system response regulator HydG